MSDSDQKRDANADALAALAGGADPTPAPGAESDPKAESEAIHGEIDVLAAMAGQGTAPATTADDVTDGDEASSSANVDEAAAALAAADAGPVDLAAELAAHDGGRMDPAVVLEGGSSGPAFEGAGPALTVEQKRARARQFTKTTKKAHAYQFKKTMIPLLLVVAAILLIMGTVAIFIPSGDPASDDPGLADTSAQESQGDMTKFRPFLIIASFVVGPVLLLGAWMFYIDVRRSDQRAAARKVSNDSSASPSGASSGRPDTPQ